MTLPASYRWVDHSEGGACLYWNYGCVASIKPDGTTRFKYWQKEFNSKAASVAQAKRFIERWINARNSPGARECALWRNRYFRAAPRPPNPERAAEALIFASLTGPSATGRLPSRIIKADLIPDELDDIADVGKPLQAFGSVGVTRI